MKILILGHTGMLGSMVEKVFFEDAEIEVLTYQFDAANPATFRFFDSDKVDYCINCIGVTAQHINGQNSASLRQAVQVNSLFPHQLVVYAEEHEVKIIHISTDGVFSGKGGPYYEDSPHDCFDIYGKTKSLGEPHTQNALTIRCSIIGPSPKKEGLFEWFLSQPDGSTIKGFTNHLWHGVTTRQFAELCREIVKKDVFESLRTVSSVFHFAPNEPIIKYELLKLFKDVFKKNVEIEPVEDACGEVKRVLDSHFQELKNVYSGDTLLISAIHKLM